MKSNQKPQTQAEKNRDRLKQVRDVQNRKKEQQIDMLSPEDLMTELKNKQLPTFGTNQERRDRLKKANGINPASQQQQNYGGIGGGGYDQDMYPGSNQQQDILPPQQLKQPLQQQQQPVAQQVQQQQPGLQKKGTILENIEKMQKQREERRAKMEEQKANKIQRQLMNEAAGKLVDADFDLMVDKSRLTQGKPHRAADNMKISVCVRKRPIFNKEAQAGEIDSVSAANPQIRVHECKYKVDGITKFIENHDFTFENSFSEAESNEDLYRAAIQPMIHFPFNRGIVTCFAYGQTGSGKTFTMKGSNEAAIRDLYSLAKTQYADKSPKFFISFFEIYGGKLFDLLNGRAKLAVLEDKNQKIQVQGLEERLVDSEQEMIQMIEFAHSERTTHATASNDTSSRSHAICQIQIKEGQSNKLMGKLFLVDLAGSERAADCQSNNRQRRLEGAEINKSLLALKECIRSLDMRKNGQSDTHIPFRASKLTMVLRDSFMMNADRTRIIMIACISPGSSSADHTLNTLRYASRLKENPGGAQNQGGQEIIPMQNQFQPPPIQQPPIPQPQKYNPPPQQQMPQYPPDQASGGNQLGLRPRAGGNALANAGRMIMEAGINKNNISNLEEQKQQQLPPRKQWGGTPVDQQQKKQPLPTSIQQNNFSKPPSSHQSKYQDPFSQDNNKKPLDNIKVRDNDDLDEDSDEGDEIGGDRDDGGEEDKLKAQQRLQTKAKQDWNYLKQTLGNKQNQNQGGWKNQQMPSQNYKDQDDEDEGLANDMLDLQDKVDNILEKEEELISQHMHLIKENAQLLTKEGELISYVQENDEYEIEEYVNKMSKIIDRKLQIYGMLNGKLQEFKKYLREEEEVHNMTVNKGGFGAIRR